MPGSTPSTISDNSTSDVDLSHPTLVLERPPRWYLSGLWDIAGFDNRRPRLARFIVVLFRPPIVSNTSPPVACELIAPPRTTLAAVALCVAGVVFAIGTALVSSIVPIWLAIIALPAGALASVRLIERGIAHFTVPVGHIRLQDVVARRRGAGVAYDVLSELLNTVTQPVTLDVDAHATGVVALYERLGFTVTDPRGSKPGITSMTRPAPSAGTGGASAMIAGIRPRWLWPSPIEIIAGAIAALTMYVLRQPGTWSRGVVVATATFAVVTAAGTDLRIHRIPNALVAASVLPLLWIATGAAITDHALVGALIMAGPLLASNLATSGRTPGLGDVKLAAVAGGALGMLEPVHAPFAALMITLLGGAVFGTIYQQHTRQRGFPLGPAIAAATITLLAIEGLELRNVL